MPNLAIKLLHRDSTSGLLSTLPTGAIVDLAGTSSSSFTVGGKQIMYADGSNATGGMINPQSRTLQNSYNLSIDQHGHASVIMTLGQDFIFYDTSGLTQLFRISSSNGTVTISGDLIVSGSTHSVSSTETISDYLKLSPGVDGHQALAIEPEPGLILSSDLVSIKAVNGGPDVLTVAANGCTFIKCVEVSTINSVPFNDFYVDVSDHITYSIVSNNKHIATEINVDPNTLLFTPAPYNQTVSSVLEFFDKSINISNNVIQALQTELLVSHNKIQALELMVYELQQQQIVEPKAFTFSQTTPELIWDIQHNKNNSLFVYTLFDLDGVQILPDESKMIDSNNFRIVFTAPQAGTVNMIFL